MPMRNYITETEMLAYVTQLVHTLGSAAQVCEVYPGATVEDIAQVVLDKEPPSPALVAALGFEAQRVYFLLEF